MHRFEQLYVVLYGAVKDIAGAWKIVRAIDGDRTCVHGGIRSLRTCAFWPLTHPNGGDSVAVGPEFARIFPSLRPAGCFT